MFGISRQRREEFDRAALVHIPELLRVASRLCGSADAGEDLLQETYLQAWRSFHRFEAGTNCRAWLYKILLFTYSAQARKRARQPFLVDLDAAGETALVVDTPTPDALTAGAVKAAFDRLPENFRTLVVLVDVHGLTYREAADALNVPVGTVMSRFEPRSRAPAPRVGAACTGIVNWSAKRVCTAEGAVVNLDCQQVREVMDSYLSEELSVETNHSLLRHVGECRGCEAELRRRRRLRALLSETLDVAVDADRVTARITHTLDRERRSWGRVAPLGAVAAALVAAVAVAYWSGGPVDAAAYDDSAEDHISCALTYPDDTAYDKDRAAKNLAPPFEHIVDVVGLSHGAYHVIDAHMCPYKGRNYAHVVIRGDRQTLSLFAERAERGALPDGPTTMLTGDTLDVHATTRLGYSISAVATRDHQLFLVSERPTDPPALAQDILRSAVRFIRGLEK